MSGLGLDPGSSRGALSRCTVDGDIESVALQCDVSRAVLPGAVLRDEALEPMLEFETPLSPFGVGGPWPPEAQVGAERGARRMPLALAVAALERQRGAGNGARAAGPEKWGWTSVVQVYEQQSRRELLSTLIRRTADGVARKASAPIAIAVANELPLLEQTAIVGRLGGSVRLVWRCMAAGLAHQYGGNQTHAVATTSRVVEGTSVLHVHLGVDGFEATRIKFLRARGRSGPSLLVPARSRPSPQNTRSRPFLGLQLCAQSQWSRLQDDDAVWTAMFVSRAPLSSLEQPVQRIRSASGGGDDLRAGWSRVLEGASWSQERAMREIEEWSRDVEGLLRESPDGQPALALLTGDFADVEPSASNCKVLTAPVRAVRSVCERLKVPCKSLGPEGISIGAALFASRRARGWATFLDELPSVEIVVQTPAGAAWKTLVESKHYDAGAPLVVSLDQFWLNAGEKHVELPVYVDEFGPDTPNVLRTRVDFNQATSRRTSAEVVVEVEAATGLPVVRAAIRGDVDEIAEVDWANDHERAFTGLRKAEYLAQLPRTFPPIEERVDGLWWIQGGKYKTVKLPPPDGQQYTGETLGARLIALQSGPEARFEPALKAFAKLAAKKEWNAHIGKWIAATDAEGRNQSSKTLDATAHVLFSSVFREWKQEKLADTAGRALAALCWRDAKWIDFLMQQCSRVDDLNDTDYRIAGLGACTYREEDMSRAICAFARRLHDKVNIAKATYTEPVGMYTLRALGNLVAHRPDALKRVKDEVASQLADDITMFIELTLERGRFMQKFQAALRSLVYLTRRRSYQDGFLPVDSAAFKRAVSCCAKVYIAARLSADGAMWAASQSRLVAGYKEDLRALRMPGRQLGARAHEATCSVIDDVDISRVRMDGTKFPVNPEKLLRSLVQVVEYIEGRGTGILVMEEDDDG